MRLTNIKIVFKQIGNLLILQGLIILIPVMVSIIYNEYYSAAGFFTSFIIISSSGYLIKRLCRQADDPHYNHALIIAASGWLSITIMGSLPFLLTAEFTPVHVMNQFIPHGASYLESSLTIFRNPIHCLFESMSAYTTTGLTMAIHEPSVGKGILLYRSLAQWTGGAGFIIMALAIFRQTSGRSAILLYGSEATGERLRPKVIETARAIWKVYLLITLFSAIYLFIGTNIILPDYPITDNIFDAINHAMAGQSTGGFSTLDDSIASYHSPGMEILYLLPMILGAFSIPFYFKLFHDRKLNIIWKDIQTRSLLIAFLAGGIIQALLLIHWQEVPNPVREGVFQFVSGMSTTGWQTSDINNWNWVPVVYLIFFAMLVGGSSGATVGGIKIGRALLIIKGIGWQVKRTFYSENTVKAVKFGGKSLHRNEMNEEFSKASSLAILFVLMIVLTSILTNSLIGNDYNYTDALFESASAQCTVGLSTGITNPSMSPVLELVYILQMWAGRLEIIPVLALFRSLCSGVNVV